MVGEIKSSYSQRILGKLSQRGLRGRAWFKGNFSQVNAGIVGYFLETWVLALVASSLPMLSFYKLSILLPLNTLIELKLRSMVWMVEMVSQDDHVGLPTSIENYSSQRQLRFSSLETCSLDSFVYISSIFLCRLSASWFAEDTCVILSWVIFDVHRQDNSLSVPR